MQTLSIDRTSWWGNIADFFSFTKGISCNYVFFFMAKISSFYFVFFFTYFILVWSVKVILSFLFETWLDASSLFGSAIFVLLRMARFEPVCYSLSVTNLGLDCLFNLTEFYFTPSKYGSCFTWNCRLTWSDVKLSIYDTCLPCCAVLST